MKRVAHDITALADLDDAASQRGDVVNRCLQRPIIVSDEVCASLSDRDAGQFVHRRVHNLGQLLLLGLR